MKKATAPVLVLAVILLQGISLSAQKKKDPVFTIILEQQGSAFGESLQKHVTARYWPCSIWNSGYYGGLSFRETEASGAQVRDTPEGLLTLRGSLSGLKPGEVMLFYVSEKTGKGEAEGCLNEVSTIGDGVFRTLIKQGDDVTTHITDPEHERYSKSLGPGSTMNALVKRTAEGALLTFSEPFLEGEGYCDYFGLFEGDNVPENIGQVFSFKLTNDDLRNWGALVRVNELTLSGPEGGQLHIKATLYGGAGPGYARVALDGCSQFGEGYQGKVTASGEPEGGSYEFRVDPADLMTIDVSGPTAILTGSRRGRGTLYVSYTAPDGAVGESSQPVSVVALYSYNKDSPIPKIGLYDTEGHKTSPTLSVPYNADPEKTDELLDFVLGDPSLANISPSASSLAFNGLKRGKTTLEAHDNCGNIVGPTVEVEVVNCDEETIARLAKMRTAMTENLQAVTRELQTVAGSPEFEKARNDLVSSTIDLLAKVGLTVVTSLKTESTVVTRAAELAEAGAAISDLIGSANASELGKNVLKNSVSQLGGEVAGTMVGLVDVGEAAERFFKNAGDFEYGEDMVKKALETYEKAYKALEDVIRRQQICNDGKTDPQKQEPPKADKPPKPDESEPVPTDPTPTTRPEPKEDNPASKQPSGDKPVTDEPGKTEPPDNPPPATEPPREVGLPYEPGSCGCKNKQGIGLTTAGLDALQTGIKNLSDCVDRFNKTAVADYSIALKELSDLTESLETSAGDLPSFFFKKAQEAKPQLDSLILRVRAYDEAGKTFLNEFEKCPESLKSVMDVLESALTVTVDSITTKY